MPLRAINNYLEYRLKNDEDLLLWRIDMSAAVNVMATQDMKMKEFSQYAEKRKLLFRKQDTRTAKQIIDETLKRHGIKVVE